MSEKNDGPKPSEKQPRPDVDNVGKSLTGSAGKPPKKEGKQ